MLYPVLTQLLIKLAQVLLAVIALPGFDSTRIHLFKPQVKVSHGSGRKPGIQKRQGKLCLGINRTVEVEPHAPNDQLHHIGNNMSRLPGPDWVSYPVAPPLTAPLCPSAVRVVTYPARGLIEENLCLRMILPMVEAETGLIPRCWQKRSKSTFSFSLPMRGWFSRITRIKTQ